MTLKSRFTLVGLGIIIFIIVTPVLTLYARGFKVDWENYKLVKTGTLVIKSQPTKAEIYLNNKKIDQTTPANIRFLLPGDYDVRVSKAGYSSWTKRLEIKQQLVTWANADRDFLTLFLEKPVSNQAWAIKAGSVSKNGNEIALISDSEEAAVIDVNNSDLMLLGNLTDIQIPLFSKDLELTWQNAQQIFNWAKSNKWSFSQSQLGQISRVETDGNRVVLMLGPDLYSINAGTLARLDQSVSVFTLEGNDVWYVQKNLIKRYDLSTGNSQTLDIVVPDAKKFHIIRAENQIYLILDDALYVVNDHLEKIYSQVAYAKWDSVSRQLIFANNNEIYIYNPGTKNSDLIIRSVSPLRDPWLNLKTGYVFFANDGKVKAIELDNRDRRNVFTLADLNEDSGKFAVSEDGKILYTLSQNEIREYTIR